MQRDIPLFEKPVFSFSVVFEKTISDDMHNAENNCSEKRGPETCDIESRDNCGSHIKQKPVDDECEQAKCEQVYWNSKQYQQWFEQRVQETEDEGCQQCRQQGGRMNSRHDLDYHQ